MHKGIRNYRPLPTNRGEIRPQSSPQRQQQTSTTRTTTTARSRSPSISVSHHHQNTADNNNNDHLLSEVAEASPVRRLGYMDPEVQYFDEKVEKKRQQLSIAEERRREMEHKKAWEAETKETDLAPSSLARDYRQNGIRHREKNFVYSRSNVKKRNEEKKNNNNNSSSGRRLTRTNSSSSKMNSGSRASGYNNTNSTSSAFEFDYEAEFEKLLDDEEYTLRVPPPPQGPPTFVIVAAGSSSTNKKGNNNAAGNNDDSAGVAVTLATSFDRARAAASGFWQVPKYSN